MARLPSLACLRCRDIGVNTRGERDGQIVQLEPEAFENEDCEVCYEILKNPGDQPARRPEGEELNEQQLQVYRMHFKPGYATYCRNGHAFHWSCIAPMLRFARACPMCRATNDAERTEQLRNQLRAATTNMVASWNAALGLNANTPDYAAGKTAADKVLIWAGILVRQPDGSATAAAPAQADNENGGNEEGEVEIDIEEVEEEEDDDVVQQWAGGSYQFNFAIEQSRTAYATGSEGAVARAGHELFLRMALPIQGSIGQLNFAQELQPATESVVLTLFQQLDDMGRVLSAHPLRALTQDTQLRESWREQFRMTQDLQALLYLRHSDFLENIYVQQGVWPDFDPLMAYTGYVHRAV